jgi:hypothetical protein
MFPDEGPAYSVYTAALWRCENPDQQARGLKAVMFSLSPAPDEQIMRALFDLRNLTRGREKREPGEDQAEAVIWGERLRQFPADIVLTTLRNWPERDGGQWWPTWHDVHKVIEAQASGRRLLAESIRSGACLGPVERKDATEEFHDGSDAETKRREDVVKRILGGRWPGHKPERDASHDAETKAINDAYGTGPNDPAKPLPIQGAWAKAKRAEIMTDSAAGKYRLSLEAKATLHPDAKFGVTDAEREARAEAERNQGD